MKNILAPTVGESITEVSVLAWRKADGDQVKNGEIILEIESDKATVEVIAEANGALRISKQAGERVPVGSVVGMIDEAATGASVAAPTYATPVAAAPSAPIFAPPTSPPPAPAGAAAAQLSPAVQKMVTETGVNPSQVSGTGKDGRVTKGDVIDFIDKKPQAAPAASAAALAVASAAPSVVPAAPRPSERPGDRRVPMSRLRLKIAERLVQAQHTAAILTTFNEVDMTEVMRLRNQHKDAFKAKYGVPLSFMSFFSRACIEALKTLPSVNAFLDGTDIMYHDYCDIGIAVGTDRGLVVPIIRNSERMGFVDIEKSLAELATKARTGKLSIADMTGGTFTISNGGVYGSLLSTPILNPPQTAILGMHKIQERPIAINGKVEVRPMMYLALSYDHRLIDGKEAVTFLIQVKDLLEAPMKLNPEFV
jgi:2-oxoglutarate dehydrogenase E2 component (dihydrolipoamide succinyltransferase)